MTDNGWEFENRATGHVYGNEALAIITGVELTNGIDGVDDGLHIESEPMFPESRVEVTVDGKPVRARLVGRLTKQGRARVAIELEEVVLFEGSLSALVEGGLPWPDIVSVAVRMEDGRIEVVPFEVGE